MPRTPLAPLGVSLLALWTASGLAGAQTTWFVDVSATPPGNGSAATPYTSIDYALAQPTTVDGDTLQVAPGTYQGNPQLLKAVTVRSTGGPASTRIVSASHALDTVLLSNVAAVLVGYTVRGEADAPGVAVAFGGGGTLRRCVVSGSTNAWGIGVEVAVSGTIEHCTISGNRFGVTGPAGFGATLVLRNSIVADNSQEDYFRGNLSGPVEYCAGLDGDPYWLGFGVGNLPGDPLTHFVPHGLPQLAPGSPCVDAGDPAAAPDPDGSRADIGALPFEPSFVPGPNAYCTGKQSSQGCTPAIGFQGQASASGASPFLVTADQVVPQRLGLLFYGLGERAKPFQGGTHCVQPPTPRTPVQLSTPGAACTGTFSIDMNAWIQSGVDQRLVPGALIHAQYWFRDPGEPAGFGTGLSDALRFAIAP